MTAATPISGAMTQTFKLAEGFNHFETGWIDGNLITITGDAVLGTDDPHVAALLEQQYALVAGGKATFTFPPSANKAKGKGKEVETTAAADEPAGTSEPAEVEA